MAEKTNGDDIPEIFKQEPDQLSDEQEELDPEDSPSIEEQDSEEKSEEEESKEDQEESEEEEKDDQPKEESSSELESYQPDIIYGSDKKTQKIVKKVEKAWKRARKEELQNVDKPVGPEIVKSASKTVTIIKPKRIGRKKQDIRLVNEKIVDIAILLCNCIDTQTFSVDSKYNISSMNEKRRILNSIYPIVDKLSTDEKAALAEKGNLVKAVNEGYYEIKKQYEHLIKRLIVEKLFELLNVEDNITTDMRNKKILKNKLNKMMNQNLSDYDFIVNSNIELSKYMTRVHRHKYKRLCNTKKVEVQRRDGKLISREDPNNVQFKNKQFTRYEYQDNAYKYMESSIDKVLTRKESDNIYEKYLRGYLLYWMLGSGKTCTVINIAEKYIEKCKKIGKNAVVNVFSLASLRKNFITEYCDICGENRAHIYKYYNFFAYNDGSIKPGFADGLIDDSLIIIDEVQVLLNGKKNSMGSEEAKVYSTVYDTIQRSKNSFIVCLSGTPIYSSEYEICLLAGLINPVFNKEDEKLSIIKKIKAGNNTMLLTVQDFDLGPVENLNKTSIEKTFLYKVFENCVSYVSKKYASKEAKRDSDEDDESAYPSISEEFAYISMPQEQDDAATSEKLKEQKKSGRDDDKNDKFNYIKYVKLLSRRCENIFYNEKLLLGDDDQKTTKIKIKPDIIDEVFSNYYFTDDNKLMMTYKHENFCQKFATLIHDLRHNFSAKFAEILVEVLNIIQMSKKNPNKGKIVIYSENVNGAGIKFFEEILTMFRIDTLMYTGEVSDNEREENRKKFNDTENNLLGEKYPVLLVSSAGSTGISLKCVRYLFILEPGLNELVTYQVKGRVRRAHSHDALPPEKRNVIIKRYISIDANSESIRSDKRVDITGTSSQLWADKIGLAKFEICKKMFRLLRYSSVEFRSGKYNKKDIDSLDVI